MKAMRHTLINVYFTTREWCDAIVLEFYIDNNDYADDKTRATSTLMLLTADSICSTLPITTALHRSPLAYLSAVCRNVAHSLSSSTQRDGVNVNSRSCSAVRLAATAVADTASNVSVTEQDAHTRTTHVYTSKHRLLMNDHKRHFKLHRLDE